VGYSFGSPTEKIVVHDNWLELMLPVGESPGEGIYNHLCCEQHSFEKWLR
jgi:hypothetical protein